MKASMLMGLVALCAVQSAGCGSTTFPPPVTVEVIRTPDLGVWGAGPRSIDLYFARVSEPAVYERSDPHDLRVTKDMSIPGGRSIKRVTVAPGETITVELGPMVYAHFTHVGVLVVFPPDPGDPGASLTRSTEIPENGQLRLLLSKNEIHEFGDL